MEPTSTPAPADPPVAGSAPLPGLTGPLSPAEAAERLDTGLAELTAATGRLLGSVRKLTDDALAAPSRLPGWTRGHVVTHLARNADAMARVADGLADGIDVAMYDSLEARALDIETGSGRTAAEQVLDLEAAADRFWRAIAGLDPAARGRTAHVGLGRVPILGCDLPRPRIQEVLIHHVDLGLGFAPDDWPKAFVLRLLDQVTPFFRSQRAMPVGALVDPALDRAWLVADDGPRLVGPAAALAAWLVGRSTGPDLAVSDGSVVPSAPPWV